MTKAAIYSSGPSLLKWYLPYQHYDETWAINTAIKSVNAHWLCAGDDAIVNRSKLAGKGPLVGISTLRIVADQNRKNWNPEIVFRSWETLYHWKYREVFGGSKVENNVNYSIEAAILHAAEMHTTIDIYGADMFGSVDSSGWDLSTRTQERWDDERHRLNITIEAVRKLGVMVYFAGRPFKGV